MNKYHNKNYIIIGAAGGIGSDLARKLNDFGANLFLISKRDDKLKNLAGELSAKYYKFDVSNFEDTSNIIQEIDREFGQIQGIVNCAGSMLLKPAHLTSEEEFDYQINTNLKTTFSVARAAGKVMANYGGSVVFMSSSIAEVGIYNHEAISSAKGGVNSLVRSAASSYANCGLRFNAVSLGLVDTPMTTDLTSNEHALEVSKSMHPLGRLGTVSDASSMILWLLDPDNSWVTGQVYNVDGGLSTIRSKIKI